MDKFKKVLEKARNETPEGIEFLEDDSDDSIPADHSYAIIEMIMDDDEYVYTRLLVTGDEEGILWAYQHLTENYETDNDLHIVDIDELREKGQPIDFH